MASGQSSSKDKTTKPAKSSDMDKHKEGKRLAALLTVTC